MFILVFIITILILVVIHEFGHYIACKKFNIKVLEFGFGLPPRLWAKKIGETLWSINWLPFGGFVRPLGEDESFEDKVDDKDKHFEKSTKKEWEERSFQNKPVSQRIMVVVAGVLMNLLLAFALYYIVLAAQGFKSQLPLLTNHQFIGVNQVNENLVLVDNVSPDSPAQVAGFQSGDRILAVNNQPIQSADQLVAQTKEASGSPIQVTLSDIQGQNPRNVEITPRVNPPSGQGPLGVSLGTLRIATLNYDTPLQKLFAGPIQSLNLATYSWTILSQTISKSFAERDFTPVSQNVAGPVGITSIVKQILEIQNPLIPYLDFVAAISLNLAIVNILPFPGLDGGRLLFLVIEAITKKKPNATIEKYVHTTGLVILLGLIFLITLSDIKKFF